MKLKNCALFKNEHRKYGIEYAVKNTAEIGFCAVEFLSRYTDEPRLFKNMNQVREARRLLDSYGLSVT